MSLHVSIDRFAFADHESSIIEGIEFSVNNGEFVCIVGPSGCGKTTLLNLIAGLEPLPESCQIFTGQDNNDHQSISYMFQNPRLMPWLNVLDNVLLVTPHPSQRREFARNLLRQVGLVDQEEKFPRQLSGGMQRRVALARAFINAPKILLLDEPFISLDEPLAISLRNLLLEQWQRSKATVIFITHDLIEALFLADRILFLDSSPARVILDYSVPIKRGNARLSPRRIGALKETLLSRYPLILKGIGRTSST